MPKKQQKKESTLKTMKEHCKTVKLLSIANTINLAVNILRVTNQTNVLKILVGTATYKSRCFYSQISGKSFKV